MGELRQTDNLDLNPHDLFSSAYQPAPQRSYASMPSPSSGPSEGTMNALIQLFRQKTDQEIATLVPGTTADKAAEVRAMLKGAGLL